MIEGCLPDINPFWVLIPFMLGELICILITYHFYQQLTCPRHRIHSPLARENHNHHGYLLDIQYTHALPAVIGTSFVSSVRIPLHICNPYWLHQSKQHQRATKRCRRSTCEVGCGWLPTRQETEYKIIRGTQYVCHQVGIFEWLTNLFTRKKEQIKRTNKLITKLVDQIVASATSVSTKTIKQLNPKKRKRHMQQRLAASATGANHQASKHIVFDSNSTNSNREPSQSATESIETQPRFITDIREAPTQGLSEIVKQNRETEGDLTSDLRLWISIHESLEHLSPTRTKVLAMLGLTLTRLAAADPPTCPGYAHSKATRNLKPSMTQPVTEIVDPCSDLTCVFITEQLSTEETLDAKHASERRAASHGVHRTRDNNDANRTALLHAQHRWSKAIDSALWPEAMLSSANTRTSLPTNLDVDSPISRFATISIEPNFKHFHPFGCPVYFIPAPLQTGMKDQTMHAPTNISIPTDNLPPAETTIAADLQLEQPTASAHEGVTNSTNSQPTDSSVSIPSNTSQPEGASEGANDPPSNTPTNGAAEEDATPLLTDHISNTQSGSNIVRPQRYRNLANQARSGFGHQNHFDCATNHNNIFSKTWDGLSNNIHPLAMLTAHDTSFVIHASDPNITTLDNTLTELKGHEFIKGMEKETGDYTKRLHVSTDQQLTGILSNPTSRDSFHCTCS